VAWGKWGTICIIFKFTMYYTAVALSEKKLPPKTKLKMKTGLLRLIRVIQDFGGGIFMVFTFSKKNGLSFIDYKYI